MCFSRMCKYALNLKFERTKHMKYAIAGYDSRTKKLMLKVMSEEETISLLKEEHHFTWAEDKIEKFKHEANSKKGYYVDFNNGHVYRVIAIA